jgi:hypothetical protein
MLVQPYTALGSDIPYTTIPKNLAEFGSITFNDIELPFCTRVHHQSPSHHAGKPLSFSQNPVNRTLSIQRLSTPDPVDRLNESTLSTTLANIRRDRPEVRFLGFSALAALCT